MIPQPQLQHSDQFSEDEAVHLPDYQFVTYCFHSYGLNRGIYNTIDEWLYRYGIRTVVERRRALVKFLAYTHQESQQSRYLKFGKGGLTKQLETFMESHR